MTKIVIDEAKFASRAIDMDALMAAADALAEAVTHEREMVCQDIAMQIAASDAVIAALTAYRAARDALAKAKEDFYGN